MGVCGDGGVWRWGCVEMGVCVNKDVCVCVCVNCVGGTVTQHIAP